MNVGLITGILGIIGGVAGIGVAVLSGNYNTAGIVGSVSGILTGIGLVHHTATGATGAAGARPPVEEPIADTSYSDEVENE